jgi:hypothetical protein
VLNTNYIDVPCDTTLYPSLYLMIDNYWVEIHPETYVIPYSRWNSDGTTTKTGCYLGIREDPDHDFWSLGIPFI